MFFKDTLWDYKITKTYSITKGDSSEWENQANINACLMRANGVEPKKLKILAFFKDWNFWGGIRNKKYPKYPVMAIDLPLWSEAKASKYIQDRVGRYQLAEKLPDTKLPECTDSERWLRSGVNTRCGRYCGALAVCHQAKKLKVK